MPRTKGMIFLAIIILFFCAFQMPRDVPGRLGQSARPKTTGIILEKSSPNSFYFQDNSRVFQCKDVVRALRYLDDNTLVSGGWDTELTLWNCKTGLKDVSIPGHQGLISSLDVSISSRKIVSCSEDKSIRVWDMAVQPKTSVSIPVRFSQRCVAIAHSGKKIAWGGYDGKVTVFDLESETEILCIDAHQDHVEAIQFSPNGDFIASGGRDQRVCVWSILTGQSYWSINLPGAVKCIAFSSSGDLVATGGASTSVMLWNLNNRSLFKKIDTIERGVGCLVFVPSRNAIIISGHELDSYIIGLDNLTVQQTLTTDVDGSNAIAVSPDGKSYAVACGDKIYVWNSNSE